MGAALIMASSTTTKNFGLPFFYLYGIASLLGGTALAVISIARGDFSELPMCSWKWIVLRGVFGASVFTLMLLAVAFGAPLGDTSALSCVNIVMSALMGRLFLGESLHALHGVALCSSVAGAVLVSQPESLFGDGYAQARVPWVGYIMAIGAGFTSGGTFIAARKAQNINPVIMTTSVMIMEGLLCFVLPLCGVAKEVQIEILLVDPLK